VNTTHIFRLSGLAAALGGALRVAAAFIPPTPDTPALELLYFAIDVSLLFGLIGFIAAATGLATIVGPDAEVFGINVYNTAVSVIGFGLAVMSIAMLWSGRLPRWIPALWIASLLAGIAATTVPDAQQAGFLAAGILFALGFLAAGVALFGNPRLQ